MLLGDYFRRRGLRGKVDLHLFTPEPQAMPVAGPELGAAVSGMLESRGIAFHPSHKLTAVHPEARELVFDGKPAARYDLLVAIPPHRGPRLVREAGLTNEAGWVPVDRRTLATPRERVYAIGDVTAIPVPGRWKPDVPLMLPKAGVFAHEHARVVAQRIAAEIAGTAAAAGVLRRRVLHARGRRGPRGLRVRQLLRRALTRDPAPARRESVASRQGAVRAVVAHAGRAASASAGARSQGGRQGLWRPSRALTLRLREGRARP